MFLWFDGVDSWMCEIKCSMCKFVHLHGPRRFRFQIRSCTLDYFSAVNWNRWTFSFAGLYVFGLCESLDFRSPAAVVQICTSHRIIVICCDIIWYGFIMISDSLVKWLSCCVACLYGLTGLILGCAKSNGRRANSSIALVPAHIAFKYVRVHWILSRPLIGIDEPFHS